MKVAALQCNLIWKDVAANQLHLKSLLDNFTEEVDLVVLPEMFLSGFVTDDKSCAVPEEIAVTFLKEFSEKRNIAICGSVLVLENEKLYNRFIWVDSSQVVTYNKRHLFSFAGEHKNITAGNERVFIDFKGWRIAPFICYDLRFPVWSRNSQENTYDLAIYVANWPEVRVSAWSALLKARAIENQCYLIGVNRVGQDGNNIAYNGASAIISPYGDVLKENTKGEECFLIENLSKDKLEAFRTKFPVLNDADKFSIHE